MKFKLFAAAALLAYFSGCSDNETKMTYLTGIDDSPAESSSSEKETSVSSSSSSSTTTLAGDSSSSSNVQGSSSSSVLVSSSSNALNSSSSGVQELSSSSVEESSSSNNQVSSSSNNQVSSSSIDLILSSSSVQISSSSNIQESSSSVVQESSSSEEESSSSVVQLIPSKDYDCSKYKCLPTQYLNPEIEYGELLDKRDNQVYRTVKIGDQVWMAQNLNYDIGDTTTDGRFVYWFSKEVIPHAEDSIAKYGRGYTWSQAIDTTEYCENHSCYFEISDLPRQGICPEGWHVPSKRDWKLLEKFVDMNNGDEDLGVSLKAKSLWAEHPDAPTGSDRFGFSALPFEPKMSRNHPLESVAFWSASESSECVSCADVREFNYYYQYVFKDYYGKSSRIALRCMQD